MEQSNQSNSSPKPSLPQTSEMVFSASNTIAVFTVLSILLKMRTQLGLEAMLEYMEKYLAAIAAQSPKLKGAVAKALTIISIEKVYTDVSRYEK